jgi:hypothetical protein
VKGIAVQLVRHVLLCFGDSAKTADDGFPFSFYWFGLSRVKWSVDYSMNYRAAD